MLCIVGVSLSKLYKGLDVMKLSTAACIYTVCGVPCTVHAGEGEMSTWLHDGWIGANRPKFAGRGEYVTSTDGVAMAMG